MKLISLKEPDLRRQYDKLRAVLRAYVLMLVQLQLTMFQAFWLLNSLKD